MTACAHQWRFDAHAGMPLCVLCGADYPETRNPRQLRLSPPLADVMEAINDEMAQKKPDPIVGTSFIVGTRGPNVTLRMIIPGGAVEMDIDQFAVKELLAMLAQADRILDLEAQAKLNPPQTGAA